MRGQKSRIIYFYKKCKLRCGNCIFYPTFRTQVTVKTIVLTTALKIYYLVIYSPNLVFCREKVVTNFS